MSLKQKVVLTSVGVTAYFGAATWLQRSFVDPRPKGKIVVQLLPPFERHDFAAVAGQDVIRLRLEGLGDDPTKAGDLRSPIVVYENRNPLGPAHSTFADIKHFGGGRFCHWNNNLIVFSASDNTDPNENGRYYWAVVPE
ncbi:hypothetical protein [Bradyrhizobium sp. 174]|uniref:hypothetical protein n=1 Tax=Bradyrhizobium sp. 174 TaxID=2782645 RepID=UPI001FF711D5|nr:hypothetical protein [Bradyrhizobium sp. 174]MCK1575915.1 hypothetical protein [Bradyrhizobium sp. 174]